MKTRTTWTLPAAALALVASAALLPAATTTHDHPARADVDRIISGWPATPQKVARETIAKYGPPHEATPSMLVWHGNGPWKHTILWRDEVPHEFPMKHTDLLEQSIDYRVPPSKFDELAEYDGSVIVERTKGEISARCDKEEMNYLALNLANDIVTGKRSVADAREFYVKTAMAFKQGRKDPYTQGLQFTVARGGAGDPDKPAAMAGTKSRPQLPERR
jgi:hypothetical protein